MNIRIVDLTRKITNGTEAYPGDRVGLIIQQLARAESDGYNLTAFTHLESHCGTHIDSPLHFVPTGTDIASLPLQMPPVAVITASGRRIGPGAFAGVDNLTGRAVLIKTGWEREIGAGGYYRDSPYLTSAAAEFLAECKIAILGMDFPSPDPFDSTDFPVHHILLDAGIPIVEGLVGLGELTIAAENQYFVAFPLKVTGIEASPVRAAVIIISD